MSHDRKSDTVGGLTSGGLPSGGRGKLDGEETASVFDGMDWDGDGWRAEASPPPSLRQPAAAYFADFPWGD